MLTSVLLIVIGFILLGISIASLLTCSKILRKGLETEGIIFDLEASDNDTDLINYPIVRFVTAKKEWITQTFKIGLFPGYHKKGAKVTVIYNPDFPTQFLIKSAATYLIPTIITITACSCIVLGIIN